MPDCNQWGWTSFCTTVMGCPQVMLPYSTILRIERSSNHLKSRGLRSLTSETDKNKSGLSSVMIRLTLSSWQRKILMQDCFTLYSVSSRSETALALAVFTSKTRTCMSPAAVALSQTYAPLNFSIGVTI